MNSETKKRAVITEVAENEVRIAFDDPYEGSRREFTVWACSRGGYVWADGRGGDGSWQVCERLAGTGNTLSWSGKAPLIKLVRRHYRLMRQEEKALDKKHGWR